jgi:ABC-2 type transport system ATP-binding protein
VDGDLTGRENLRLFARLHRVRGPAGRAGELLERFGLAEAADRPASTYSGGMRRRLDLAACLVRRPDVLFLDEPTTGLDPAGRNGIWQAVRELRADGTTVLLTTQYLEEADQLADNIVVVDKGRIIAEGSPLQLKQQAGNASLVVTVSSAADLPAAQALLSKTGAEVFVDSGARQLTAAADGLADMVRVAGWLRDSDIDVDDIGLSRPSLDDVFLSLTGHRTEEEVEA